MQSQNDSLRLKRGGTFIIISFLPSSYRIYQKQKSNPLGWLPLAGILLYAFFEAMARNTHFKNILTGRYSLLLVAKFLLILPYGEKYIFEKKLFFKQNLFVLPNRYSNHSCAFYQASFVCVLFFGNDLCLVYMPKSFKIARFFSYKVHSHFCQTRMECNKL